MVVSITRSLSRLQVCDLGQASLKDSVVTALVKVNITPNPLPKLDDVIMLNDIEVREAWRNPQKIIPESLVLSDLAPVELSVSLPAPKRRRDAVQLLG